MIVCTRDNFSFRCVSRREEEDQYGRQISTGISLSKQYVPMETVIECF